MRGTFTLILSTFATLCANTALGGASWLALCAVLLMRRRGVGTLTPIKS